MRVLEAGASQLAAVECFESAAGASIEGRNYTLRVPAGKEPLELAGPDGEEWARLYRGFDMTVDGQHNLTQDLRTDTPMRHDDGSVSFYVEGVTLPGQLSTQYWRCFPDHIETYCTTNSQGRLESLRLFGGINLGPNRFGLSMSGRQFESVYNPQPSGSERQFLPATERTEITTAGMWQPGRKREFIITPPVYGFGRSLPLATPQLNSTQLMAGVSAPLEQQNFASYSYDAHEDGFSLLLDYDGYQLDGTVWQSPTLLLSFAENPRKGLRQYTALARRLGHLPAYRPPLKQPAREGITWCTWGEQVEQARFPTDITVVTAPADILSAEMIDRGLEAFAAHDVPVSRVVIDDKWQQEYGRAQPDQRKFADLAAYIGGLQAKGMQVILWDKGFDPEGVPPELTIRDCFDRPVAGDPTNPDYIEFKCEHVQHILQASGLGADGLKLDFLAQLPHGPGLRWHGPERGYAALHRLYAAIAKTALAVRPTAILQAHFAHPGFADTYTEFRLNDINEQADIIASMEYRRDLGRVFLPRHAQDIDGWPMPNAQALEQYIAHNSALGRPLTTHYVSGVQGQPLGAHYFSLLRQVTKQLAS